MNNKLIIPLLTILISCSQIAYSQTEVFFLGHQFGVGARAMSMGGAFLAISDDYTASYWNPAGLAQLRRMELTGAMSHFMMKNNISYPGNANLDETNATKLNALGFVIPYPTYRGSLVFALGYNRVRSFDSGFSVNYSEDNGIDKVNTQYDEIESGSLINWVFSGAIDVTKNLSVGTSINIWRGTDDYQQYGEFDDELNLTNDDYTIDLLINTNFSAVNVKLGALYKLGILGKLAAMISTPVKLNATANWEKNEHWFNHPILPDSSFNDNDSWDYKIKSPIIFGVGAAFTLFPNLIIAGDIEYSDWSQLKYLSEPLLGTKSESNINFKTNYQATTQYRVGAEFTVPLLNLQLRGGFFNQPSPLKNAGSSADRRYFTAGVGLLLDKQVKVDLAWLKGWWKDESYFSSEIPSITEKIDIDKILATVAFRF